MLSFVGRALLFLKETYLIELCARPRVRAGQPLGARFVFISLVYISKERGRRALQQSELCRAGPEFARAKRCSLSYTYVISSETRNNKLARKVCQPRGFRFGRSRAVVLQLAAIHTRALYLQPRAHYPYGDPWPCAQLSLGMNSVLRILY